MAGVKGRSGPRAKPSAVHEMQGTARKDRHGGGVKAPRTVATLSPPRCLKLTAAEKAVFREVVELLDSVPGLLADVDAFVLGLLCEKVAERNELRKILKKEGRTCESKNGAPYQHPAVGQLNGAEKMILDIARDYGMNPVARDRLDVAAKTSTVETGNRFEQYLAAAMNC
ncbi:Phage terminase, small subunit [Posidoniimonas corsicana]|uniref:Phage terminase, small subunit n=2 Tax=Posidoniimonas corsicana TaxID=1938618 RepID=A0A5C5UUH0_9BACT|nr:Phage terminase, small subunit [Posidoniimonas corsicana]